MKLAKNMCGRNLYVTNQITHVVLNTGKTCEVPPVVFTSEDIRMFRQLVKSGGGPIPIFEEIPILEGTDVVIKRESGCAFAFFHDCCGLPLIGIVVGLAEPGAADTWDYIKRMFFETSACENSRLVFGDCEYPKMPSSLPWIASHIYRLGYSLEVNCPECMQMLATCGQGLAAAMIELDISSQLN